MMSHLQPNSKRYWGEEKNIDSIYSIYLKKICYTFNSDISTDRRGSLDDSHSSNHSTVSSNDLTKYVNPSSSASSNSSSSKRAFSNINDGDRQKKNESPCSRRNFFQKYRRRSCSMDKYSLDKHHKGSLPTSTTINNSLKDTRNKTMRSPTKEASTHLNEHFEGSHDELDCFTVTKSSDITTVTSDDHASLNNQQETGSIDSPRNKTKINDPVQATAQSLQWETRQIKILQAATLDHVLKFILLINSSKDLNSPEANLNSNLEDSSLEDERNNVAHIIHVFFCTYRIYTNPLELMLKLMDYSDICRIEQYRFVMHYWIDNYPEDFEYIVENSESNQAGLSSASIATQSMNSFNKSITSYDSSTTTWTAGTSDSENSAAGIGLNNTLTSGGSGSQNGSENLNRRLSNLSLKTEDTEKSGVPLISELLRLCRDEYILKKAARLNELRMSNFNSSGSIGAQKGRSQTFKNSAVLDLDSRYVAQQLTAIDLENFLNLRPYSLLEGTKSDKRVKSMVKNFNLLSRHVVVTILKSHQPNIVTAHWIAIAMNLRKMKNFNSLKAVIAGLTNESIYRLKHLIWNKLDRTSLANFKSMASIVDDVNNQIVLRQTQLMVEGTAKMSIEDDSFGTIPYLGTFLTDLNMIDARCPSHVPSPKDETSKLKLINFEKCAKQFEILTQVQLLQKNVLAALHAIQRRNHFDEQTTLNRTKLEFSQNQQMLLAKPAIPQVSRLFENWFYDTNVASMTDKQW